MNAEIEVLAEQLYDANPARSYHPAWHQLGDVTKSVWRERAQAQLLSDFA
jgi:hypothetical protein